MPLLMYMYQSECKVKVDYLIDCLGYGANWRDRPLTMAAGSHRYMATIYFR